MNYSEFQQRYEEESDKLYSKLTAKSEDELLEIIADASGGQYNIWKGGDQYQIWNAISAKGTSKSIQPLFEIVSNLKIEYLVRYHACNALFKIVHLDDEDFKGQVQYGLDINRQKVDQHFAIEKLAEILF